MTRSPSRQDLVADIWRDVLRARSIDPATPFVAQGGSSVLAAMLAARLRRELSITASIAEILDGVSVVDLARRTRSSPALEGSAPAMQQRPASAPETWLLERPRRSFVGAISVLPEKLAAAVLGDAVRCVVASHAAFRTHFMQDGATWFAMNSAEPTQLEVLGSAGAAPREVAMRMVQRYKSWPRTVPMAALVKGEAEDVFCFVADHSHLDGESVGMFMDALADSYESGAYPAPWSASPVFVREASGDVGTDVYQYWAGVFDRVGPFPRLNDELESARGEQKSDQFDAQGFSVALRPADPRHVQRLRAQGTTVFMLFAGSLLAALSRMPGAGRGPLGIMTASAGRHDPLAALALGNFAHEITVELGASTRDVGRAIRQVRENVRATARYDRVHRSVLLDRLGGAPASRGKTTAWLTIDEPAHRRAGSGPAGPLRSFEPLADEHTPKRVYAGIGLHVDLAGSQPTLQARFSGDGPIRKWVEALVVAWGAAVEEALG
ncbi:condensation domain-containing protein [Curtobacterium sp. MCPF17_021]|uniref:condensation domain-containing protein n=1 Tax=Curtobacterium sp. MCPF17_021 TaxID=2175639 RepID=UPI000DA84E6B|nr:condensation domain-containing protein [Curtobacterium sp. MCPF17_021]WIE83456.1 condensation domain-containing protein [Curtobacterium sp. MCPF17_021]